ncbi:hypothetical protein [Planomonospora sp. ID82291]|uniref:hypothetical protein n=1 Tax=Planomonospora sp. ID82291 TaxID=2738136 RepID=UPI0018C38762|nr:hypothetical protein [Planomonospora sp. ID82291]MBG0819129.1 hypothetical protein [Planomonospora sp. ID82291]
MMLTKAPVVDAFAALGLVLAALVLLWRAARALRRGWCRVADFLDDWNGQPARPGHKAIPSVPARISALETSVEELRNGPAPPTRRQSSR